MKIKKVLIWCALHNKEHKLLTAEERKISGYMPLISSLFPGINYYSISGFYDVFRTLVVPVLEKEFSTIKSINENDRVLNDLVEVSKFMSSNGYEWQDSEKWKRDFQKKLACA